MNIDIGHCFYCGEDVTEDEELCEGAARWSCGHAYCATCLLYTDEPIYCTACGRSGRETPEKKPVKFTDVSFIFEKKCAHEYCSMMSGVLKYGCIMLEEKN